MGTPEFAVPSLATLIEQRYALQAVVTGPDKPRGRGQELSPTPIKQAAVRHSLRVLQPASLKDQSFFDEIRSLRPDLIVVVAFRILPPEILTIPRLGTFNLHASLLPKYRGAAPINWAIINGDEETGVTTFLLEEKVDTGSILLQARTRILPDDDAGSVHDKLSEIGAEIVLHTVRLLEQGKARPHPQDHSLASPAPKIHKEDCRIRWDQPALRIHNLIRGLSPTPGACTSHAGRVLKVYRSKVTSDRPEGVPGAVAVSHTSLRVLTGEGALSVLELQQEGRRRMPVEEFLRGYRLSEGDTFV